MGAPGLRPETFPAGEKLTLVKDPARPELSFFEVNMGNPHAVFFVPDVARIPAAAWGPEIERHARFPHRTNVEFVQVMDQSRIRVVVWERGAGFTLACGTGGCAAAVAAILQKLTLPAIEVEMPGGVLRVAWGGIGQPVLMEGPAAFVFDGVTEL
jgi:diaminopimelate epimerase